MMPWTLIMADFLERGKPWDLKEVAERLRKAQAEIDSLKKEWNGLNEDELLKLLKSIDQSTERLPMGFKLFARAIEAELKEKNR